MDVAALLHGKLDVPVCGCHDENGEVALVSILITGAAGNLGARLVVPLVRRGERVVLFDLRRKPLVDSPEFDRCQFIEGDLSNFDVVRDAVRAAKVQTIFHLAAILSSDAEGRPDVAWRVNLEGTRNLLEAARQCDAKRVIFSSTVATYGANLPQPLALDAPQWPVSLYGVTKVAAERLGVYYRHRFGLDFRGIRFPAVVAPRGAAGGASAFCSAVFEESALKGSYEFYIKPATRCPVVYIADAVGALIALSDAPREKLRHCLYNIYALSPSAQELETAVRKRLPTVKISYQPDPLRAAIVESWPSTIDDRDARQDWGWNPTYGLDAMTEEILETLQPGNSKQ